MPSAQDSSIRSSRGYRARLCQRLAPRPQKRKTIWSPPSSVNGESNGENNDEDTGEDAISMDDEAEEEAPPNEEMEAMADDDPVKVLLQCVADMDKRLQSTEESVESTQQDVENLKAAIQNIEEILEKWQKQLGILGDEQSKGGGRGRLARAKPLA